MCFLFMVLLVVIIGAVANDHPPANPPFLIEEVKTTEESRVLERVEELLQSLSAKIKLMDDRGNETNRDIIEIKRSLFLIQNETNEMLKASNKSLQNVLEQMNNLSTSSTRCVEHKLSQLPENTGVYFMRPDPSKNLTFAVSRDFTNNHGFGNDWIVFQRRFNGSLDFYQNWTEYRHGFGDLRGEHWLGLDKLHAIVETRRHELLIVLEDFDDVIAYAHYDDFKIGNETEKYIIKSVGKYTGTAGDSFTPHKGYAFSTYDQDNDLDGVGNCAKSFRGGWWFYNCYQSHLNGEYLEGRVDRYVGIGWLHFRGLFYSLKSVKMMVRPVP